MSKLASAPAALNKDELKAWAMSGDTSVPGVEMSDLNDGDILARTRENVNPNGQFQYIYIPEDGSDPITSDWIGQDFKKQVLRGWVDGVKSAIIGRGHAGLHAANEAEAERKLKALQEEQMDDAAIPVMDDVIDTPVVHAQPAARTLVAARGVPSGSSDPSQYVEDQLDIARERLQQAETLVKDATREVLLARRDYEKWNALAGALSGIGVGSGSDDSDSSDVPVNSATLHSPQRLVQSSGGMRAKQDVRPGPSRLVRA